MGWQGGCDRRDAVQGGGARDGGGGLAREIVGGIAVELLGG